MQVENIMLLADEWADECAGCDSSHLTESSLRRKVLQRAVEELVKDAEAYRALRKKFDVKVDADLQNALKGTP